LTANRHGPKCRDELLTQNTEEDIMSTVFRVILEGTQETPPNNSEASGVGTVIFDSEAVAASYSFDIQGVDFGPVTGGSAQTPALDDNVTRTHFHTQVAGLAGPIVLGRSTRIRP
jgi:serralysin